MECDGAQAIGEWNFRPECCADCTYGRWFLSDRQQMMNFGLPRSSGNAMKSLMANSRLAFYRRAA
jgi:hypothetical protein